MSVKEKLEESLSILEKEPRNPVIIYEIGRYFYDIEDYSSAVKFYERAHQLDFDNRTIFESLAECYFQLGHYDQALEVYDYLYRQPKLVKSPLFTLLQAQLEDLYLYLTLLDTNIQSLQNLDILIIGTDNENLIRTLTNWGASSSRVNGLDYHWESKEMLPFSDHPFDIVIVKAVKRMEEETELFFVQEVHRVLKASGLLILPSIQSLSVHQTEGLFRTLQTRKPRHLDNYWQQMMSYLEKLLSQKIESISFHCLRKLQIPTSGQTDVYNC